MTVTKFDGATMRERLVFASEVALVTVCVCMIAVHVLRLFNVVAGALR